MEGKPPPKVMTTIVVDRALWSEVSRLAIKMGLSKSRFVERALRVYIKYLKARASKPPS